MSTSQVVYDKIKFYILNHHLHQTALMILEISQVQKVKWCMKHTSVNGLPSNIYLFGTIG